MAKGQTEKELRDELRARSDYVDRLCRMIDRKDPRLVPKVKWRPKKDEGLQPLPPEGVPKRDADS